MDRLFLLKYGQLLIERIFSDGANSFLKSWPLMRWEAKMKTTELHSLKVYSFTLSFISLLWQAIQTLDNIENVWHTYEYYKKESRRKLKDLFESTQLLMFTISVPKYFQKLIQLLVILTVSFLAMRLQMQKNWENIWLGRTRGYQKVLSLTWKEPEIWIYSALFFNVVPFQLHTLVPSSFPVINTRSVEVNILVP